MKLFKNDSLEKRAIFEKLIDIFFIGLILIISFWNISKCDRIIIIDDEFGYWGVAAHIAGVDWSDFMSDVPYFAYGQALILTPLMLLAKAGLSMPFAYKIALACNGIMLACSYPLIVKSVRKISDSDCLCDDLVAKSVGLFATLSICNSTKILQTWPEISCFFVFWLLVYELISFFEKQSYSKIFLILLYAFLLLSLHMRTIGVFISVVAILLIYWWNNRKTLNIRFPLSIIIFSLAFAALFYFFKRYCNDCIYTSKDSVNDMNAMVSNSKRILSVYGIVEYLFSVLGKIYYSFCETFGLCVIGWIYSIYILLFPKNSVHRGGGKGYIFGFALLTSFLEILICAIKQYPHYLQCNGTDVVKDNLVYGRYQAFAISLSAVIGIVIIVELINQNRGTMVFRISAVAILFMIVVSFLVQLWANISTKNLPNRCYSIRWTASPWLMMINTEGMDFSRALVYVFAISMFILFIIMLVLMINNKYFSSALLICMSIIFGVAGIRDATEYALAKSDNKVKTVEKTFEILKTDSSQEVFCVCDNLYHANGDFKILQWRMGSRPIKFVYFEDIPKTDVKCSVYLSDPDDSALSEKLGEQYDCIFESDTMLLWMSDENNNADPLRLCGEKVSESVIPKHEEINLSTVVTEASYTKINNCIYQNWDFTECYLTQGMKVTLDAGTYEFKVNMDIADAQQVGEIGFIETGTVDGEKIILQGRYQLNKNRVENEKGTEICVKVTMEESGEPYVAIYTYGNSVIKINSIFYSKVAN